MWSLEFRESILHLFYCGICATTLDTRRRTEDRFANFDWQPPKNPVTTSPLARSYLTPATGDFFRSPCAAAAIH